MKQSVKHDRSHVGHLLSPGIISLVVLPLLLVWYVYRTPPARSLVGMELNIFPDSRMSASMAALYPGEDVPPQGDWTTLHIDKRPFGDTSQFAALRIALRSHVSERDTEKGICIHIDREAPYDSFVRTVDILNQENVARFWIVSQDIWVPKYPRYNHFKSNSAAFICGGVIFREMRSTNPRQTFSSFLETYQFLGDRRILGTAVIVLVAWIILLIYGISIGLRRTFPWRVRRQSSGGN